MGSRHSQGFGFVELGFGFWGLGIKLEGLGLRDYVVGFRALGFNLGFGARS